MSNTKHDLLKLKEKIKEIYSKENKQYFEDHVCIICNPDRKEGYHLDLISKFLVLIKYNIEAILVEDNEKIDTCVVVTKCGYIVEIEKEYICKDLAN